MAGRTPDGARDSFLAPLRRALDCVTNAQFHFSRQAPGSPEALTTSEFPLRLRRDDRSEVLLGLAKEYRVIEAEGDRGPYKIESLAYEYRVADAEDTEVVCWHWHPQNYPRPHVHVRGGLLNKAHVPTGRVSIEAVIEFAVTELSVVPQRDDYLDVLRQAEQPFLRWRTWSA